MSGEISMREGFRSVMDMNEGASPAFVPAAAREPFVVHPVRHDVETTQRPLSAALAERLMREAGAVGPQEGGMDWQ
jgi:hypothetical protein